MLWEVQGSFYAVSLLPPEPAAPLFMIVALTLAQKYHKKGGSEAEDDYLAYMVKY